MVDKKSLVIGMMAGFIIGTILTSAIIVFYAMEILSSIPPGIVQNMNMTVAINETKFVEAMNASGAFNPDLRR